MQSKQCQSTGSSGRKRRNWVHLRANDFVQAGQPNGFSELSMYHMVQQISRRAFTAEISSRLTFSFMPPQVLPGAVRVSSLSARTVQSLSIQYSPLDGCTSARRSCMGRFLSAVHPVPDPSSCSECCLLVRCCYRAGTRVAVRLPGEHEGLLGRALRLRLGQVDSRLLILARGWKRLGLRAEH
jgi:hypothetical protein